METEFWKNLLKSCAARHTSVGAICDTIGVSRSSSTKWKNGAEPRWETVCRIAETLETTPQELYGDVPSTPTDEDYIETKPTNPYSELFGLLSAMTDNDLKQLTKYAEFILSSK